MLIATAHYNSALQQLGPCTRDRCIPFNASCLHAVRADAQPAAPLAPGAPCRLQARCCPHWHQLSASLPRTPSNLEPAQRESGSTLCAFLCCTISTGMHERQKRVPPHLLLQLLYLGILFRCDASQLLLCSFEPFLHPSSMGCKQREALRLAGLENRCRGERPTHAGQGS